MRLRMFIYLFERSIDDLVCRKLDQTRKYYHISRRGEARATRLCQAKAHWEKHSLARLNRG
jgi:hypothetical protein